ncbi:hypothetical protein [Methanorbis furvi]|uniref:Uncharacterized protein n=1 Tax=Methanorbis furvi TaxID=3028299 RepID=A0AAE4MCK8_9EURY|nr:hypothetical protein [Methanocorpusculaceae archaeon Ag1]
MEGENKGENIISPERKERVAVCLVCSNEWLARTGTAKKPAKCPVCGTKRCVWKDDAPTEPEKHTENTPEHTETHEENKEPVGEEPEKTGEIEEKIEEKREEKRENNIAGYIKNPVTEKSYPVKKHSSKITDRENEEKTPEEKSPAGSFPIVLVVAGLVVLGCLAGVGWFLGRCSDTRNRSVPADFRPPTAAERAMIRVGV